MYINSSSLSQKEIMQQTYQNIFSEINNHHWQLKPKVGKYGDSFEITMNIEFPPNFPYDEPNIYFSDIYIHPWIDGSVLKKSYPAPSWENNFSIVEFISSIITEFTSNSPKRVGGEVKNNRRLSITESIVFPEVNDLRYLKSLF